MSVFIYLKLNIRPGVTIAYRRHAGKAKGLPGVLFCGGFRSDMQGIKAAYLEAQCEKRDQSFVRFDYTGHGFSSGKFEDGCIGSWLEDALEVFDNLTKGPQIVVGSSMGGWIALLLALRRRERVAGLVGLAPAPDFTEHIYTETFGEEERRHLLKTGLVYLPNDFGPPHPLTKNLFDDGRKHLLLRAKIPLTCPVRLIHSRKDASVPWQTSEKIREMLTSTDVRTAFLDDGDHRLSREQDLELIDGAVAELGRLQGSREPENA